MGSVRTKRSVVPIQLNPIDSDLLITASPHQVVFVILGDDNTELGTVACDCPVLPAEGSFLQAGDCEYTVYLSRAGKPHSGAFKAPNGGLVVVPYRYLVRVADHKLSVANAEISVAPSDLSMVREMLVGVQSDQSAKD